MNLALGIDGGGTRTRALLVDPQGEVLAQAETGPSNINQVSESVLAGRLRELCSTVLQDHESAYACFGLAGSAHAVNRSALLAIISSIPKLTTDATILCSDADIGLHGAFANEPGMLLIGGTGSICIGINETKSCYRVGGWGLLAGDYGSGHWIGNQAIEIALQQADGRCPKSALLDSVLQQLGIHQLDDLTDQLKLAAMTRNEIAALCPIVCELAQSGDEPSQTILHHAVEHLIALVRAARRHHTEETIPLCLSGGVLKPNTVVRRLFEEALLDGDFNLSLREPKLPAVGGATLCARQLFETKVPDSFIQRLSSQLTNETAHHLT